MSFNDVIELNVGGKRFVTTRQTLLKEPQSVLAKMFEIDSPIQPAAMLKDGSYFIDRDPKSFEIILNFLRNDELADISKTELKSLKIEASYFMLENLLSIINERLDTLEVYRFRGCYNSGGQPEEFYYYVRKSYFEGVPLHVIVNFFTHRWIGAFRSSLSKDPFQPIGTHFVTTHDDNININPNYNIYEQKEPKQYIELGRNFLVAEMKKRKQQK